MSRIVPLDITYKEDQRNCLDSFYAATDTPGLSRVGSIGEDSHLYWFDDPAGWMLFGLWSRTRGTLHYISQREAWYYIKDENILKMFPLRYIPPHKLGMRDYAPMDNYVFADEVEFHRVHMEKFGLNNPQKDAIIYSEKEVIGTVTDDGREVGPASDHYRKTKYEAIDVIDDWKLPFRLGCALKYLARYQFKHNEDKKKMAEDLRKAAWYCTDQARLLDPPPVYVEPK